MEIKENMTVELHYTLTNEDGEVIDSSRDEEPLAYLHGHQNIVPGLEKALMGRVVGDSLKVRVEAVDGYGEKATSGPGPQQVPVSSFPEDFPFEPGMQFIAQDDAGNHVPVWIKEVDKENVTIDFDHPLAGQVLNFDVEVLRIREATEEELAHGHSHGFDGQHGH